MCTHARVSLLGPCPQDDILQWRTLEKARAEAGVQQLQRRMEDTQASAAQAASEVAQLKVCALWALTRVTRKLGR